MKTIPTTLKKLNIWVQSRELVLTDIIIYTVKNPHQGRKGCLLITQMVSGRRFIQQSPEYYIPKFPGQKRSL